ncbi:hypothetical protein BC832DRAFT_516991, partial [Gaertneriomyces semiglobifer]
NQLKASQFVENAEFGDLVHKVIEENILEDEEMQAAAKYQKVGFLNINDQRVYVPWGRVSDAEDILGTVRLSDGAIVPSTYERMPTHRLVSGNGLFQLTEFLHQRLLER